MTKWPPRSPDLNPCDFLCGYFNAKVYCPLLNKIDELKLNTVREIKNFKIVRAKIKPYKKKQL